MLRVVWRLLGARSNVNHETQNRPGRASSSAHLADGGGRGGYFCTTQWSLVLQAGGAGEKSTAALEQLCRAYWPPLFTYVRRQGHDPHTAQDLTQEFFARLLQGNRLAAADPERGRFRSFLLASLKNFLINEWQRGQRQKRGGGAVFFSLAEADDEDRHGLDLQDHATPERLFERRWAETLIARVNARLRREYEAAGWGARFEALKVYLLDDFDPPSYAETAAKLGLTEAALKSAIYKLRQRYGLVFRAEIAGTIANADEVEEEIEHLFQALAT
jgi:RNA polymerase sigma factor (sigma-70 family)